MSATGTEASSLERLAAARSRGAEADELLDLGDAAIVEAVAAGDAVMLERIAAELDAAAAAAAHDRGLRIASARARAGLAPPAPPGQATVGAGEATTVMPMLVPAALVYASWVRRVAALVIDCALLYFVLSVVERVTSDAVFLTLWFLLPVVYFVVLHARFGRTLGKLVTGIVVRRATGEPIDGGVVVARTVVQLMLVFTVVGFFVDSAWPLWDRRGQTLHDKAANTVVTRSRTADA